MIDLLGLTRAFAIAALSIAINSTGIKAETLRIGAKGSLASLDPHELNETFSLGVLSNVMEGLVRRDHLLRLQPGLATSWQRLSPRRWRFHLRRGVRFHDGAPFSADDVVFSFERARQPQSQLRMRLPAGMDIEKVDQHTVDFHLSSPNPILHANWEALLIMSADWAKRHKLEQVGASPRRAPDDGSKGEMMPANGTGPYRLTYHRPGQKTLFARNPNWWGANTDKFTHIEMHTVSNAQTRTAALLSRQVDLIVPAPLADLQRIDQTGGMKTIRGPELRTIFLNMDQMRDTLVGAPSGAAKLQHGAPSGAAKLQRGAPSDAAILQRGVPSGAGNPLRDVRVRRAIYQAIDADAIANMLMRGRAVVASSLMSPLVHAGVSTISRHPYDPAQARALLAKAGYAQGFTLPMDCPNNRYVNDAAICKAVAGMLGRVGIRVHLNIQAKALFFAKVLSGGGYDSAFSLIGWSPSALDGLSVLNNVAQCRDAQGNGGRFNLGGYCNREVDRLAAAALVAPDRTRRAQFMTKALQLIHNDVGFIPLHQQTLAWAMSDRIDADARADNQIRFNLIRPHGPHGTPRM